MYGVGPTIDLHREWAKKLSLFIFAITLSIALQIFYSAFRPYQKLCKLVGNGQSYCCWQRAWDSLPQSVTSHLQEISQDILI